MTALGKGGGGGGGDDHLLLQRGNKAEEWRWKNPAPVVGLGQLVSSRQLVSRQHHRC